MKFEWIENGEWDKVKLYINTHPQEDFTKSLINGNNILHLAVMHNEQDIITYLLDKAASLFDSVNKDGNNVLHLLSYYGNNKLFSLIADKLPHLLNVQNNDGNTPMFFIVNDKKLFDSILKNYKVEINHINNNKETLLTYNTRKCINKDDIYYKNIQSLIDANADLNIPSSNLPLHLSIIKNKFHILKKLIKSGADVNKPNKHYITPLIVATGYDRPKIIKYLIEHGADVNNNGPEGDENPMNNALIRDDIKTIRLFVDNGYDINSKNRFLETPLHVILDRGLNYPYELLMKMIYLGDLTKQNIDGVTPLHTLISNYDWRNFSSVLKIKKLDIFIKDNEGKSPFSYISDKDIYDFMEIVAHSYINNIKSSDIDASLLKKCECIEKNCISSIKTKIIQTRRSYPLDIDYYTLTDFTMVKGIESVSGKFNSDSFHNLIYTVNFINKHPSLGVPFKYYNISQVLTEKKMFEINLYRKGMDNIVYDLVAGYTNFLYELSPYIIIWKDKNTYYIDDYLKLYIKKLLLSDKIRFIYFKLTLVVSTSGTHANIILYDKHKGIMERFDPYGYIPYLDIKNLDILLKEYFSSILPKNNFTYLTPHDFMGKISFQTISNDGEYSVKRLGDPVGFCLAWTFWYMDMRLSNPDIHPKKLVKEAIDKIINNNKANVDGDYIFINFIREYASLLDKEKTELLISLGVDNKYVYNLVPRPDDEKMVSEKLGLIFNHTMTNRLDK